MAIRQRGRRGGGVGDASFTTIRAAFSRVYQMSFGEGAWKIWRQAPGFWQRYSATIRDDGGSIRAAGKSPDGSSWEHDLVPDLHKGHVTPYTFHKRAPLHMFHKGSPAKPGGLNARDPRCAAGHVTATPADVVS
jgi:hypothetical protein